MSKRKSLLLILAPVIFFTVSSLAAGPESKTFSGYIIRRGGEYRWTESPHAFEPGFRIRFKNQREALKRICVFAETHHCPIQQFKVARIDHEKTGYVLVGMEPISPIDDSKVDRLLSSFK